MNKGKSKKAREQKRCRGISDRKKEKDNDTATPSTSTPGNLAPRATAWP